MCWSVRSSFATSWRRRCRASESGLEAGKNACTSSSRWERLNLCLQYVARVKKWHEQKTKCKKPGKPLHRWRRSLRTDRVIWRFGARRLQHSHDIAQNPAPHDKGRRSHQVESSGGRVAIGATSCARGRFQSQEGEELCSRLSMSEVVWRTLHMEGHAFFQHNVFFFLKRMMREMVRQGHRTKLISTKLVTPDPRGGTRSPPRASWARPH